MEECPQRCPGRFHNFGLWQAATGDFLLNLEDGGRYRVRSGSEIVIDTRKRNMDRVAPIVGGTVWTAVLQQRGYLTLHASVVRTGAGAVLFLGRSGTGKSTLAWAFARRGYEVVSDDIAAVQTDPDGTVQVLPGHPYLRLWADVLARAGEDTGQLRRVRSGLEKYFLPVRRFSDPQTVSAAYVLKTHNSDAIRLTCDRPVVGLRSLRKHTHRRKLVDPFGHGRAHFQMIARIVREVPVVRVTRPAGGVEPQQCRRPDRMPSGLPRPVARGCLARTLDRPSAKCEHAG